MQKSGQPSPKATTYMIIVKGHLDSSWSDWFDAMTITHAENGETLLSGPVIDQSALHGLLNKVRDLGLILISVSPLQHISGNTKEDAHDPKA
jgi:hypothetical protein